jgi:NAD(P)-dependent dehydrogenase (short-subunit alcohol dehydrogenase family)
MTQDAKRTVLVGGGSGGIGSAICTEFARRGYTVSFTYRSNRVKADELAKELGADAYALDLTDAEATAKVVAETANRHGKLDAVVYAAGPNFEMSYVSKLKPAVWAQTFATDVNGCFNLFRAALDEFRKVKAGSIVSVSTCALRRPPRADVLSAAPKAAIDMLVKCIAKEEGRNGIRANLVELGFINAGLAAHHIQHVWSQEILRGIQQETPMRRFGTGEEVAKAVAFLCSDDASFISGETIAVDGGYHL